MAKSCSTLCDPHGLQHTRPPCPSPTPVAYSNSMSIESVMPSYHLILCRPLLLLPSIFPSISVFSGESVLCIRWPKYWSFSISPSNEYSGLISFRIDWFDLLAVQGSFRSLLQYHSSKASILWCSAFFTRKSGNSVRLYFLGCEITADGDCSHEIKMLTPWKESYDQPR